MTFAAGLAQPEAGSSSGEDAVCMPSKRLDGVLKTCEAYHVGRETCFSFADWDGPALKTYLYLPEKITRKTLVLFVMHGVDRNSGAYFREWLPYAVANKMVVIVPRFGKGPFRGTNMYQCGNTVDEETGKVLPNSKWSFSAIPKLFKHVRKQYGVKSPRYSIYGHSAGAQFVHRFVMHKPNTRLAFAIAANAGWYTMPSYEQAFPYGLEASAVKQGKLKRALRKRMVVLLGSEDTNANCPFLRRTSNANQQGTNRFDRGTNFVKAAKRMAKQLDTTCRWRVRVASGIGHMNVGMAQHAMELLLANEKRINSSNAKRNSTLQTQAASNVTVVRKPSSRSASRPSSRRTTGNGRQQMVYEEW